MSKVSRQNTPAELHSCTVTGPASGIAGSAMPAVDPTDSLVVLVVDEQGADSIDCDVGKQQPRRAGRTTVAKVAEVPRSRDDGF